MILSLKISHEATESKFCPKTLLHGRDWLQNPQPKRSVMRICTRQMHAAGFVFIRMTRLWMIRQSSRDMIQQRSFNASQMLASISTHRLVGTCAVVEGLLSSRTFGLPNVFLPCVTAYWMVTPAPKLSPRFDLPEPMPPAFSQTPPLLLTL